MATNLLQPTSTNVIDDSVPIRHDLGSSETRNAELENILGYGQSFYLAKGFAANGFRDFGRLLLDFDQTSCALL
jgi:hypothetical protein